MQFFTVASFDEASYPPSKKKVATEILNEMKNPYNKGYYLFLEYALNFFNEYNALFQSKDVMIHQLRNKSIKLLKDVCQNYLADDNIDHITTTKLDDPRIFVPLEKVFLGRQCENYIKNAPPQYLQGFNVLRKKCIDFYVTAAVDMAGRLPSLRDMQFDEMRFIDAQVALSSTARRELPDLPLLGARFGTKLNLDLDKLTYEWRTLPNAVPDSEKERLMKMGPEALWAEVSSFKSGDGEVSILQLLKVAYNFLLNSSHSNLITGSFPQPVQAGRVCHVPSTCQC